jgi:hypothetical protein
VEEPNGDTRYRSGYATSEPFSARVRVLKHLEVGAGGHPAGLRKKSDELS